MFIFCIFMFWRKVDCSVKNSYIRTVLCTFLKKTVRKYNVVFGFPVFFILEKKQYGLQFKYLRFSASKQQ